MKPHLSFSAFALAGMLLLSAGAAHADSIVTFGSTTASPNPIDPAGTPGSSLTLSATTPTDVGAAGASISQDLTFISGYDGNGGPLPFSISDPVQVDGNPLTDITINGIFTVSPTSDPDTITIDAGTYTVDGITLSLAGLTFPDSPPFPGGVTNENLSFTALAPTPEPSSFVLLGTGLIGAVGAARRRGFSFR